MNSQANFTFSNAYTVRVIDVEGSPWFVAADVCLALGLNDTSKAISRLDDDEKGTNSIRTPSGDQQMLIINESGLYSLILTSRKPEAKKFKKWVTAEVLPAIRKTGKYEAPQAAPVDRYIDLTTHPVIRDAVRQIEARFWFGGSASNAAWGCVRKIGGCRATAFPESLLPQVMLEIARINERTDQFFTIKMSFEQQAIKWVFGTDAKLLDEPNLPKHKQLALALN